MQESQCVNHNTDKTELKAFSKTENNKTFAKNKYLLNLVLVISTDNIQCKGQLEPEFNRSEQTESFIRSIHDDQP